MIRFLGYELNLPIFKIGDFRRLLLSRGLITMALQVQAVIVGWQIYQIKQEALLLGLIGLTEALPAISCSFFAGHLVDVSKPSKIYKISLLILTLNTFFILGAVLPYFHFESEGQLLILFMGIFISGAARSLTSPSAFALIPQIVPRPLFSAAAAMNSSTYTFAQIVGPALGGLIYGFAGPLVAFSLPCLLGLTALFAVYFLNPLVSMSKAADRKRESVIVSILAGMKFVFKNQILLSTMALDMFSVLFGGAVAVLPIFADQVFKTGAIGLGLLRAAPAVGSVLVSIYLSLRPMKLISGSRLLGVIFGFGVATICFAITTNFYFALFFLVLSGVFDGVNMIIRGTIVQLLTPENMRGRVSSLSTIFITSSNEIGAFESGVAANFMGLIPSVIFGGVMTLVVVLSISWKVPALRKTKIQS